MRTYDGFMVSFTEGLFALRTLDPTSPQYHEKEQVLGRICFEAEEYLLPTELRLLKASLGLSERVWRQYKGAFIVSL